MRGIDGSCAVVTGAASGIGLSVATTLAQAGAHVVLSDIQSKTLAEHVNRLQGQGLTVSSFVADAAQEPDIAALVAYSHTTFGSLDILVNNAGMQHVDAIEDFPVPTFTRMIQLMLIGPFIAIKYALPIMKQQQFGRIINMASINGLIGFAGKAAYNSAKHGLIGLTQVAALEGATYGITVNALCPGYVDTPLVRNQMSDLARNRGVSVDRVLNEVLLPLIPQRRLISVQEIADYVSFLASEKGRSITGQAVVIDGGYLAQ